MKKVVVMLVAAAMALMASAATTDWKFTSASMVGADGTAFTGTFQIFASGGDLAAATEIYSASGKATYSGVVVTTDKLAAGTTYDFYYVITDGDKGSLTSTTKSVMGLATGSAAVSWGNQKTYTSNAENWKSGGDAPEPTSGLLLLIGGAMLALRRKQK